MMQAGRLRHRITLQRKEQTQNPQTGALITTWATVANVWAAVEPLSAREFIAAQAAQSEVTARIRMRFRPWMTAEDRVIHNGTIYNIVSVIDVRSENRELVLMCKALS